MLKRVIERYLRASSEREYEVPFRQLLWTMGYELLESRSIHHPFEFGKDIRAIHPTKSPRLWLFQTKRGNASQSDWLDMERQLTLMLEMPVTHPNVQPNEPAQSVWVCTGDLKTTVESIMAQFNEKYKRQGHLPVKVWNINKLVDLFAEHFFEINICPDEITIEIISLLSSFQNSVFDISRFNLILARLIGPELSEQPKRTIQQTLATAEIVTYYVLGRAYEVEDLYSAIEAIQSTVIHIWKFGRSQEFRFEVAEILEGLRTIFKTTIDDLLEGLEEAICQKQGLFASEDGMAATILYPHRTFEMLGIIGIRAWLAYTENDQDTFDKCIDYIEAVIVNNPSAMHPVWERAQEDILITGFVLWKAGKTQLASDWIAGMADWVAKLFTERGGIARPSASPREVIEQLLAIHLSFSKTEPVNTTYMCYSIIEMCYWFDLEHVYNGFVEKIKNFRLIEFQYENESSVFDKELIGRRIHVVPPSDWKEFRKWYNNRYVTGDPSAFQDGFDSRLTDNLWVLLVASNHFGNRAFPFLFRSEILN